MKVKRFVIPILLTFSNGAWAGTVTVTGSTGTILPNTVDSTDITDGTITSTDIGDETITSTDIANGTITSTDIANGTIVSTNIAGGAVSFEKLSTTVQSRVETAEKNIATNTQEIGKLKGGVAMAMALSGMQHPSDSNLALSLGVGHFSGESAVGFQASYKTNDERAAMSFGIAASGNEVGGRMSMSIGLR